MMAYQKDPNQRAIFLFSHYRTASNLFMRLFEVHPELSRTSYIFYKAWQQGPEALARRHTPQIEASVAAIGGINPNFTYQYSFDTVKAFISDAHSVGRIPFIKEHTSILTNPRIIASNIVRLPNSLQRVVVPKPVLIDDEPLVSASLPPGNPTVLPSSFLITLRPVFHIRHPAKIIPSMYRAAKDTMGATVFDEDFPMNASFQWQRLLFDWYKSCSDLTANAVDGNCKSGEKSPWPIVIDGDDLINYSHAIVSQFCDIAGLNVGQVQYSWSKAEGDLGNPVFERFLSTLRGSSGIINGDKSLIVIEQEAKAWSIEFGQEISDAMVSYANAAMPDYEYLMQFRLHI